MIKFRGYEIMTGWLVLDQRFRKGITEKVILKLNLRREFSFGRNIISSRGNCYCKNSKGGKELGIS